MPAVRGRPLCCGRTYLAVGMVDKARDEARRTLDALAGDLPVIGLEPSCLLTLRDEFRSLLPGAAADALADRALLLGEFLAREKPALPLKPLPATAHVHGHCHQKSFGAFPAALDDAEAGSGALTVKPIASSCCGMAGSFGYQAETQAYRARWPRPVCCRRCAPPRPRISSSPTAPPAGTRSAIWPDARRSIPFGCSSRRWHDDAGRSAGLLVRRRSCRAPQGVVREGLPNSTPRAHASPTRCATPGRARSITGPIRRAARWR